MATRIGVGLVVVLALLSAGCTKKEEESGTDCSKSSASPSSGTCVLGLYDNYFENKDIYVKAGATVSFRNEGTRTHTATADDGSWTTGDLAADKSATHQFATAATVPIHCQYHRTSGMVATVHVTP